MTQLARTLCPVCNEPMLVQLDGQKKKCHGSCRKAYRAGNYHKCNTNLCTGRKFEEIGGKMLCEPGAQEAADKWASQKQVDELNLKVKRAHAKANN